MRPALHSAYAAALRLEIAPLAAVLPAGAPRHAAPLKASPLTPRRQMDSRVVVAPQSPAAAAAASSSRCLSAFGLKMLLLQLLLSASPSARLAPHCAT
jgi:hypothetical protein